MSLISEALKKARQEAARQDSLRQGVPYAVGAVDPPQRRNPLLPLLAGLGAGCLLAGILFGGAWIAGVGPFDKPEREAQVAQAPAAPQETAPAPTPVVTEIAPSAPAPPPVAATPVPEERPQPTVETPPAPPLEQPVAPQAVPPVAPAPVEEQRPAVLVPEPSPAPPSIQIQPTRPAVPAPVIPGGLEEGKVYAGEVPIPGGGSLKLNGIAYSQDQPIVVLDGRVMGPGEVIQGFTVVEIQSDRVKLQGHGATVFVTTK